MQSGMLRRDTLVETRVGVLVFAHGPYLRSTSTAHGIIVGEVGLLYLSPGHFSLIVVK
jgi:hypothetical protein